MGNSVYDDIYVFNRLLWKAPAMKMPEIKKVIFNRPATIVIWSDNTKTVVKCENENFDREKGLAMAIAKKALGNKGDYFNVFKKWCKEEFAVGDKVYVGDWFYGTIVGIDGDEAMCEFDTDRGGGTLSFKLSEQYIAWCKTDEGKQYLKGGSKYKEETK